MPGIKKYPAPNVVRGPPTLLKKQTLFKKKLHGKLLGLGSKIGHNIFRRNGCPLKKLPMP